MQNEETHTSAHTHTYTYTYTRATTNKCWQLPALQWPKLVVSADLLLCCFSSFAAMMHEHQRTHTDTLPAVWPSCSTTQHSQSTNQAGPTQHNLCLQKVHSHSMCTIGAGEFWKGMIKTMTDFADMRNTVTAAAAAHQDSGLVLRCTHTQYAGGPVLHTHTHANTHTRQHTLCMCVDEVQYVSTLSRPCTLPVHNRIRHLLLYSNVVVVFVE